MKYQNIESQHITLRYSKFACHGFCEFSIEDCQVQGCF